MNYYEKIRDIKAKHSYDVEVNLIGFRKPMWVYVEANSRTLAAKRAEKVGFMVRSVNMVG